MGTQGAFVYLGTLKVLPTETMLPGFPPKLRNRPRMFRNNSLSAGWSYRPQTHQAGLPEVQGAHPKTQRLSKFARVKKRGHVAVSLRLGWPYGPAGVGTAANGSRSVGHGPISPLPLQDFGLSAHNKQPSLPRSKRETLEVYAVAFWEAKYRGLRTPIYRVADHPRGKLGRGRTT